MARERTQVRFGGREERPGSCWRDLRAAMKWAICTAPLLGALPMLPRPIWSRCERRCTTRLLNAEDW